MVSSKASLVELHLFACTKYMLFLTDLQSMHETDHVIFAERSVHCSVKIHNSTTTHHSNNCLDPFCKLLSNCSWFPLLCITFILTLFSAFKVNANAFLSEQSFELHKLFTD